MRGKSWFDNGKVWIREHIEEVFLCCCLTAVISMFIVQFGCFASDVDWFSQHSVFPDYFRKLFYKTGKLVPSFAANIGGGQNIYNFSYYGLLSPLILPSYLLPFLKMDDYIMGISVICILASVILLYQWLLSKGFMGKVSCSMAVCYLFATPVLYQSYTQWMFINYMPFLILAFMGVDRYIEKKKPLLLVVSVFLMVMTSYYFSIGGLFALALYQIAMAVKNSETFQWKSFLLGEIQCGLHVLSGLLLSGILLLPTALTLVGRSSSQSKTYTLKELLLPDIKWSHLVYSAYGIGLTTLMVTALLAVFFYKKAWERFLGYSLLVVLMVPIFEYLLNGGLYLRGKVWIPFIPLLLFWMAHFLMEMRDRRLSPWKVTICFGATILLAVYGLWQDCSIFQKIVVADAVIMLFCHFAYEKFRKMSTIVIPVFAMLIGYGVLLHGSQKDMVTLDKFMYVEDQEVSHVIEQLKKGDKAGYRIERRGSDAENGWDINRIYHIDQNITTVYSSAYESDYDRFRKKVFGTSFPHRNILMQGVTNNEIFLQLMGVKYLISEQKLEGMSKKMVDGYQVYDMGTVAPLGYVTHRVLSEETYEQLQFPYNQTAFAQAGVVENKIFKEGVSDEQITRIMKNQVREVSLDFAQVSGKKTKVKKMENGYHISTEGNTTVVSELPYRMDENTQLFIEFDVKNKNPQKDMYIRIGGEKNKLTSNRHIYYNKNKHFRYGMPWNKKRISIVFSKGDYEITNIKCYLAQIPNSRKESLYKNPMDITNYWEQADTLEGTVESKEAGYLITSIPYSKGFTLLVDGKKTQIQKVNEAFVGTYLSQGKHKITLQYTSPGLQAGKIMSITGLLVVLLGGAWRKRKESKLGKHKENTGDLATDYTSL